MKHEPWRIIVIGGHGGRLDHMLANALLLASPDFAAVELTAQMGKARVHVLRHESHLQGTAGDIVTLVAPPGLAPGVRPDGLLTTLREANLPTGSTTRVSNDPLAAPAPAHRRPRALPT